MKKPVIVLANEAGQVINLSKNNPEFGYIRVSQTRIVTENGWAEVKKLSALISGKVETLKAFEYKAGQELPGQIRIVEQMVPFDKKNPDKDIKMTDTETGIICSVNGEPIYRKHFYEESTSKEDVLIQHDNGEEIKQRKEELKENKANLG